MTLSLVLTVSALYGIGAFLLMQRNLSRIVIGLAMLGHGANLLLLQAGGRAGRAPLVGVGTGPASDPLPQALALTAIVITFGVSAYLLTMAYRNWLMTDTDEVEDDLEDRRIAMLAEIRTARQDDSELLSEDDLGQHETRT